VARGKLRLYLGAAPGVGKTYAMLNEGWRRKERGTDVVIGWVEEHGRPQTDAQIRDLEIFPRRVIEYRGRPHEEMDLDGLLARRPELVLVDELAHSNVPGSKHAKRYEDVEELLDAGINVISTINLQHLESLNDVVAQITGVVQHETVPDPVVRAADQIELVDMAPEALRRRMAHGNVYPPERIDAALGNYFRTGNLTALRELALLWVADRVDEELADYRDRHDIAGAWETKERVVVSLTGSRGSAVLIRRAARMATRIRAELVGVHVRTDDTLSGAGSEGLIRNRDLLEDLGGRFVEVVGAEVAPALVQVARAENATQLVIGATHRSRVTEFVRGSVINSIIREAGGALDVHVIATAAALEEDPGARTEPEADGHVAADRPAGKTIRRHRGGLLAPLSTRRRLTALALGVIGFPLLTLILTAGRTGDSLSTALSSYLVLVVVVAATGGVLPAALAAVAGFLLSNYYFAPPIHTFTIADARDILALVMFLVTAGVVSVLVDLSARRTATANQARTDARMLARVAGRMVAPVAGRLPALLEELIVAFRLDGVSVLRSGTSGREDPGRTDGTAPGWLVVASAGTHPPDQPGEATLTLPLTEHEILALRGADLTGEDRDILSAFAAQLASVLESDRLQVEAAESGALARANRLRSAFVAAVANDLRAPLAVIKSTLAGLGNDHPAPTSGDTSPVVETIDRETDRLVDLVGTLVDLNRLDPGSFEVLHQSTDVEALLRSTVAGMAGRGAPMVIDVPAPLPPVRTDPELLRRAVANLIDNALTHAQGTGLRIEAAVVAGHLDIRVIDRGPGLRRRHLARDPRTDDHRGAGEAGGAAPGLAVARLFVEALGGELDLEDTPGGGTTTVIRLPDIEAPEGPAPESEPEPSSEPEPHPSSAPSDGVAAGVPGGPSSPAIGPADPR
jgi:two-component system sensor histidine kinase KdpD